MKVPTTLDSYSEAASHKYIYSRTYLRSQTEEMVCYHTVTGTMTLP